MRPDPFAWNPHVEVLAALAVVAFAYARARRSYETPPWRVWCFAGGVALVAATALTPLDSLSYHLLTAHLLQNVVLAEWAPALFVLALPPDLAAAATRARPLRYLTHPLVALALWLANYFLWHLPPAYDRALENEALLHLEHGMYLATGVLLWWPVLQDEPHRLAASARALYLFAAFLLASPLGLLLALLPEPVYGFYEQAPERVWGLSPLTDQQVAGITMAAEESALFFAAFTVFFFRFLAAEEREPAPT